MVYIFTCLDHSDIKRKCSLTDQPCAGWKINLMLPKVVNHNGAHELFVNTYVVIVVGQRYYYIDSCRPERTSVSTRKIEIIGEL